MIKAKKHPLKERYTGLDIFLLITLIAYTLVLALLFYWAIITSLKSQNQFYYDKVGLPAPWNYKKWLPYFPTIELGPVWNFGKIFNSFMVKVTTPQGISGYVGIPWMIIYSLLYAVGCAIANTATQCVTAYVCAKYPCKMSSIIHTVVIIVMIIPIVGSLPAEIQLAKNLGIFDTIWGQWIMKANFLGLYFLVFFSTFKAIPKTYQEAAKIDGAGNFYIMTRIFLPLVRNEFFTILLINFIAYWNDYQIPLLYLPSKPTIAYGIYQLSTSFTGDWAFVPYRIAGAVMMLVPILTLFIIFHKRLLGNLTVGGIKG